MKKTILLICLAAIAYTSYSNKTSYTKNTPSRLNTTGIDDGWYVATIKYHNYSTGTQATYTLNVKVEYEKVTKIDFGNGGSVHSGFNNEGYIYQSGYLSYEYDYNFNIIAATTTVKVSDLNGIRTFKIRIE